MLTYSNICSHWCCDVFCINKHTLGKDVTKAFTNTDTHTHILTNTWSSSLIYAFKGKQKEGKNTFAVLDGRNTICQGLKYHSTTIYVLNYLSFHSTQKTARLWTQTNQLDLGRRWRQFLWPCAGKWARNTPSHFLRRYCVKTELTQTTLYLSYSKPARLSQESYHVHLLLTHILRLNAVCYIQMTHFAPTYTQTRIFAPLFDCYTENLNLLNLKFSVIVSLLPFTFM